MHFYVMFQFSFVCRFWHFSKSHREFELLEMRTILQDNIQSETEPRYYVCSQFITITDGIHKVIYTRCASVWVGFFRSLIEDYTCCAFNYSILLVRIGWQIRRKIYDQSTLILPTALLTFSVVMTWVKIEFDRNQEYLSIIRQYHILNRRQAFELNKSTVNYFSVHKKNNSIRSFFSFTSNEGFIMQIVCACLCTCFGFVMHNSNYAWPKYMNLKMHSATCFIYLSGIMQNHTKTHKNRIEIYKNYRISMTVFHTISNIIRIFGFYFIENVQLTDFILKKI